MKTATTTAAQLEEAGRRLDASYHASEGIRAHHFIRQWAGQSIRREAIARGTTRERVSTYSKRRLDTLAEVCVPGGVFIPGRFKRIYVDNREHGEPWLSPSDMLRADLSGLPLVSRKFTPAIETLRLHQGWILLSRSGTIGNMAYVRSDMDGLIGSDDIIRIAADQGRILSGYLYAYLCSPIGRSLIEQQTYGAVIPHIEVHHVTSLPIPRLDAATEQRIHELVERASVLWTAAQAKLREAQKPFSYLLTGDVTQYFPHNRGFSVVRFSELDDRLGAHYHSGTYRQLETRIRSGPYEELGRLSRRIFAPPPFKHIYLPKPNQYPFMTGGELVNRRFTDVRYLSKHGVGDIDDYVMREGWLAVYKSGQLDSMLGTAFYISKRLDGFCLSDHVIRIIVDEQRIDPAYVYAFLSTWAGRLLVIRRAMGKSVPFVREETVSTIPVPLLDGTNRTKIARLVMNAFFLQADSLDLEDQARALLAEALGIDNT